MPQAIIYTDQKENKIVETFSKKWKLSKTETIKMIIRKFKE